MTPFEALGCGRIEIITVKADPKAEEPSLRLKSGDSIGLLKDQTKELSLTEGDRLIIPNGVTMLLRFPTDKDHEPVLIQGRADGGVVDEDGKVEVTTARKIYNLHDHDLTLYPTKVVEVKK